MPVSKHTPSMFDAQPVDMGALAELADRSIPREALSRDYCNLCKSTDLFDFGYSISHWINPKVRGEEVVEYNPRSIPGKPSTLPRVTARSYEDQVAIHEAIGARVVSAGKQF